MLNGQHYIEGQWQSGTADQLSRLSPINQSLIWQGRALTVEKMNSAVSRAHIAQKKWAQQPLVDRIKILERFAQLLERDQTDLVELIHLENGKPRWEALTEINACINKIALSIAAYKERTGSHQVSSSTQQLKHRPHGVFLILGPYNFPAHLPNGHIAPALLAGNAVILKPSEYTPASAEKIVSLWLESGLPSGVISLIQGNGETGAVLSQSNIDGLLFTGSWLTGQKLHRQFAGKPEIMLALEMGGNNPLVVTDYRELKAAVYTILQSAFMSGGQRCTCARRLILVESHQNRALLKILIKATQQLKLIDTGQPFYGPLIDQSAADFLFSIERELIKLGGDSLLALKQLDSKSPLLSPAIIDVSHIKDPADVEYFGPLLQVIWVKDFNTAIDEANNTQYGLAAGLISQAELQWQEFQLSIKAGVVNWNQPLTGASSAMPFGGMGHSGNHRPSAYYAADYCAWPMASLIQKQVKLPENLLPGVLL